MNHQHQSGMSLVEVLVAMLLLGVAVVGYAALQVRSVDATSDAANKIQAAAIATELAERMSIALGNSANTKNAPGDPNAKTNTERMAIYRDATKYSGTPPTAAALKFCDDPNVSCTPTQLVQYDIDTAVNAARTLLPNGQVRVGLCPNSPVDCVIVSWNNTTPTVGAGGANCMTTLMRYNPQSSCVFKEGV